jgi:succinate-acetate transporter protein
VSKIADPSTVGLTSFAIGLFCLASLVAGLVGPAALAVLIPLAMGVALIHFVSGTFGFIKGELFTAVAFYGYGLFWFTFSLLQLGSLLKWYAPDNGIMLALYVGYTIFTVIIFLATLVTNTVVI